MSKARIKTLLAEVKSSPGLARDPSDYYPHAAASWLHEMAELVDALPDDPAPPAPEAQSLPSAVRLALSHVRNHFPEVTCVTFEWDGSWAYTEPDGRMPQFMLGEIDERLLDLVAAEACVGLEEGESVTYYWPGCEPKPEPAPQPEPEPKSASVSVSRRDPVTPLGLPPLPAPLPPIGVRTGLVDAFHNFQRWTRETEAYLIALSQLATDTDAHTAIGDLKLAQAAADKKIANLTAGIYKDLDKLDNRIEAGEGRLTAHRLEMGNMGALLESQGVAGQKLASEVSDLADRVASMEEWIDVLLQRTNPKPPPAPAPAEKDCGFGAPMLGHGYYVVINGPSWPEYMTLATLRRFDTLEQAQAYAKTVHSNYDPKVLFM